MPRPRRHYLDDLADDLFEWIQEEIEALTLAFQAGGRSPFAAPVSERDKLAFYTRALFNKNGSPNEAGRKATMARVGVDQYVAIMRAVTKGMQGGLPEEAGEMPGVPESAEGEAA
jgi:hypothetical protein